MSVRQTMGAVHKYAPTLQDRDSVAAGLGSHWIAMASPVQVS